MDYGQTLQQWHDFYLTSGAASAALAGLLFVGLSLHIRVVVTQLDVRSLARITLSDFFVVLLVSLFVLIPTNRAGLTATELVGVSIASLLLAFPVIRMAIEEQRKRVLGLRTLWIMFGLSLFGYIVIGGVGVLLFLGKYGDGLSWLVGAMIVLLLVAVRNTWDVLVTVGEKTH